MQRPPLTTVLLVFLFVVDIVIFAAYTQSNPGTSWGSLLIGYLQSTAFSIVTVSIVIPLLLAYVNHTFNIGEAVQQRKEAQKRAERELRLDAISKTTKLWGDVYDLCGRSAYCKGVGHNPEVEALKKDSARLEIDGEDVIIQWAARFPNLSHDQLSVFVGFLNILLGCNYTVMAALGDSSTEETGGVEELQASLDITRDSIRTLVHVPMIHALNLSSRILEESMTQKEREGSKSEIVSILQKQKGILDLLMREEVKTNTVMPLAKGDDIGKFRSLASEYREWRRSHAEEPRKAFHRSDEFSMVFTKIPHAQFVKGMRAKYSHEYLHHLARLLGFNLVDIDLKRQAVALGPPPSGSTTGTTT